MTPTKLLGVAAIALSLTAAAPANAATVDWTAWTSDTTGTTAGSANGTAGSVGVSYSGEVENLFYNYPSWGPSSTFSGGTVGNPPPSANGIIQLFGQTGATDTITFSSAVTNPVLAIWSLGGGTVPASFVFTANEPYTIESGGPSNEYGGSSIYTSAPFTVSGAEGNGTIQFMGTFTSVTWTNPQFEDWYGFTVGVPGAVPEAATWAMMLFGMGAIGFAMRRRAKVNVLHA